MAEEKQLFKIVYLAYIREDLWVAACSNLFILCREGSKFILKGRNKQLHLFGCKGVSEDLWHLEFLSRVDDKYYRVLVEDVKPVELKDLGNYV